MRPLDLLRRRPLLTEAQFRDAHAHAAGGSILPGSTLHGEDHWRGVATQGLLVAAVRGLGRQGRAFAILFGLFHDSRRENDGFDPRHGERGADALDAWARRSGVVVPNMEILLGSIREHDGGTTTADPLRGLGWDADRSLLTRVGIEPDPDFFSCLDDAEVRALVQTGFETVRQPPSWSEIWMRAEL